MKEEGSDAALVFDFISSAILGIMIIVALCTAIPSIIGDIMILKN